MRFGASVRKGGACDVVKVEKGLVTGWIVRT